jgi:hypothetical protein
MRLDALGTATCAERVKSRDGQAKPAAATWSMPKTRPVSGATYSRFLHVSCMDHLRALAFWCVKALTRLDDR